ncbi:MAG: ubiquinone/menaquinone biosynthesis methyltransferase [Acidobacteriota bacterium]|nr:ubiquinone/menaquinone biosynthesis methyltransferase [Acidobacteriota bacterium]
MEARLKAPVKAPVEAALEGPAAGPESGGLDKTGGSIREMFAGVAPRYDLLNRLLSARRDVAWRRQAAAALALPADSLVLDLCCGTGDQALAAGNEGYRVVAADFCLPMLALARRKYAAAGGEGPLGAGADSLRLPFADETFDGATASFGLRNLADLDAGLREIARVLKPRGRVAFLEAAVPRNVLRRPYLWYFTVVLPRMGRRLSPCGSAYAYLPASVLDFPQRDDFVTLLARAGLAPGRWRDLSAGAVCLYTAQRERRRAS